MSYLADLDPDNPLAPLQAVFCTYRIALGSRAGQKDAEPANHARHKIPAARQAKTRTARRPEIFQAP
jgi:hypothetical protein